MSNRAARDESKGATVRERIDALDWAKTALGARAQWPQVLSTAVDCMLGTRCPVVLYWGRDFTLLYNDAFASHIGTQHPFALGVPAQQVLANVWSAAQVVLEQAFADGETSNQLPHDAAPWLSTTPTPIRAADGTVAGIMHSFSNETVQGLEQALHEVKERNHFLECALSHMGDYVYVWDRDKTFVYANERLEALWDLSPGGYLGKTLRDFGVPPDLERKLTAQVEQVFSTGEPVAGITPYTSPTGIAGHYEYIFNPLLGTDGEVQFVAGVSRDVSERHRANKALRKSDQRYRALFESIDEGFCIFEMLLDRDGTPRDYRWLETNPAFERHTGLVDAVGRTARELVPDLEPHWVKIYGDVALTGKQRRFVEHSQAMGRWFEVDAFRIGDPEELKVGLLFVDITQRMDAERALKDADERKDQFLATLAHELRNPLAAISAGVDILKLGQDDPSTLSAYPFETMERQTSQLVNLVDDLLEVSRITRGTLELRKQRVNLADVATSALESCQPLLSKSGHHLSVKLPSEDVTLNADPQRLSQVLSNLLSNAAKYTPPAGHINLSATVENGYVLIAVADTGIGIAKTELHHIFKMFAQVDSAQDSTNQGLGVGLALAKSLVEMHGGQISVTSEGLGHGSEFTVRLPIAEPAPKTEVEILQPETPTSSGHKVLIVDDNADAASTLCMLIDMLGNTATTANSGERAIALAEEFHPQVIFMDLGMPGMDGFAAARRIREQPWGKNILIVALSGWGQDEDKRKSEEAGFDHHLVKPAELGELKKILSSLDAAPR